MRPSVVVYAKDIDSVARFYASVLEMSESARTDGYISLQAPSYAITVVRIRPALAAQIEISTPPKRREDIAIKMVVPVDSLDRVRAAVSEFGGAIGPIERQWEFEGSIRCDGNDPEGNVIQFAQAAHAQPV